MGIGILAPVPAVLMKSALETYEQKVLVAFGTNNTKLFEELIHDLPVLIYPTVRDGDPDGLGRSSFSAIYDHFETANGRGRLDDPALRPAAALDKSNPDTPWLGFWLVRRLHKLPERVDVEKLTALNRKTPLPKSFVPRGPMIVKAEFLHG